MYWVVYLNTITCCYGAHVIKCAPYECDGQVWMSNVEQIWLKCSQLNTTVWQGFQHNAFSLICCRNGGDKSVSRLQLVQKYSAIEKSKYVLKRGPNLSLVRSDHPWPVKPHHGIHVKLSIVVYSIVSNINSICSQSSVQQYPISTLYAASAHDP